MSIAGMVVWVLTAGIGIYLLAVGIAAQRTHDRTPGAPEGSPLLEFVHPALALVGLTFWIFYVMTGYRTFAWIAFGVVVATVAAGLSWETVRRRTRRLAGPGPGRGPSFPPHLIMLHAAAAAGTFALVVITAAVSR